MSNDTHRNASAAKGYLAHADVHQESNHPDVAKIGALACIHDDLAELAKFLYSPNRPVEEYQSALSEGAVSPIELIPQYSLPVAIKTITVVGAFDTGAFVQLGQRFFPLKEFAPTLTDLNVLLTPRDRRLLHFTTVTGPIYFGVFGEVISERMTY